jgi:DNA-binding FadR family transcriptional regulator
MDEASGRSLEDRIEADLDFHRLLCRLSGNETLLHQWQSLEGSIRMSIMFAGLERATSNMSVDRHRDIVDAIESGDAVTARETILAHMESASNNLVSED